MGVGWGEEHVVMRGKGREEGGSDTLHQNKYILFIDCSPAKRERKKEKKIDKGRQPSFCFAVIHLDAFLLISPLSLARPFARGLLAFLFV